MTRREALSLFTAPALLTPALAAAPSPGVAVGFSLYGMKSVSLVQAFHSCARIGYDGVEMCLTPGWTPPESLDAATRRGVKTALAESRLRLLALMEQLSLVEREMPRQTGVDRIKRAAELGHSLAAGPPLIESVLGGKPADWEAKDQLAERLSVWAGAARSADCLLCVKAHAGAAVDRPDKLLWLYRQVNSPNVKLTYDYSHFQAAGLPLAPTLEAIIPETRFIHVKDAKGTADHPQFLLTGDGGVDYEAYFKLLRQARYSGPIVAEVSSQLQKLPGYDADYAARHSYERIARAIAASGLPRAGARA